ncbi:tyrosine-protein phosphatase [Streptomyces sannanensis]|uniref:Tyrosine-protein phosphatase n=1 Tax=Streptomyces sannanensis TaxID=285536 RepID=A0ABP6S8Q9_9ACTN
MTAIPATTVANVRDLGGTALPRGRSVRPGLVFRSGRLDRLDPAADPAFAALGLRTIIDLRTAPERSEHPDRIPDGVRLIVADVLADTVTSGAMSAAARLKQVLADPAVTEQRLGGGKAQELFKETYRSFVTSDSAQSAYRVLLTELAEPDAGPLLVHCTAGKDRTGWAVAVLLTLLGADKKTIEREYLIVNAAVRQAFAPLVEGFIAQGGDPETALAVIGVVPEYLAAGLAEVDTRYGSMEKYVREGLGVPDAAVERIRTRLVTDPAAA